MNIYGYKKHLKEMKRMLKRHKGKDTGIKKVRLERHIKYCNEKISNLRKLVDKNCISGKFGNHTRKVLVVDKNRKFRKKRGRRL